MLWPYLKAIYNENRFKCEKANSDMSKQVRPKKLPPHLTSQLIQRSEHLKNLKLWTPDTNHGKKEAEEMEAIRAKRERNGFV